MKKFLLLLSLIVPILFDNASIVESKAIDNLENENEICANPRESIVRILNNYDLFSSNGVVYKEDEKYTYIITSSSIVNKTNNYKVLYKSGITKNALILGHDNNNKIAIIRTEKVDSVSPVCFANSNYLYKGQQNYAYGYYNISNEFYIKTNLSQIGILVYKKDYINVYKNVVQIQGSNSLKGTGVFDELNRLVGIITDFDDKFEQTSYVTESNKLIKIADSIVKTGKYNTNYIKYNLEDYSGLSSVVKKSYGVNKKIDKGVVITTFKPFNYLFGGLNQGMVIVAVNGVEIRNKYELDKQLTRYNKKDTVCLTVIKKNGKTGYYYVSI